MTASGVQGLAFAVSAGLEPQVISLYDSLMKKIEGMVLAGSEPAIVATAINLELKKIEDYCTKNLANLMPIVYNTAFHWTIVEEQLKAGIVIKNQVYSPNWCQDGKTFYDRILANNNQTLASLNGLLMSGQEDKTVLLGLITDELSKAKNSWLRLLRTETEASYSQGVKDALIALGYLYAVIDNPDPCDRICVDEVGERRVTLAEARVGLDLPPFHPNCKCVFRGIWYQP